MRSLFLLDEGRKGKGILKIPLARRRERKKRGSSPFSPLEPLLPPGKRRRGFISLRDDVKSQKRRKKKNPADSLFLSTTT